MHFSKIFFTIFGIIVCVSYLEAQRKSDISTINDYSHENIDNGTQKIDKNKKNHHSRKLKNRKFKRNFNKNIKNARNLNVSEIDHTEEMLEENGTSI